MHMRAEAAVELEKTLDAERGQEEWHRQTERVDGQQKHALRYRVLGCRQAENHGVNGANARRPAEGEGEANDERTPGGAAALDAVQPRVGIKRLDLENTGQVQAKDDDDHSCYLS